MSYQTFKALTFTPFLFSTNSKPSLFAVIISFLTVLMSCAKGRMYN